jgi:hypothetical protein
MPATMEANVFVGDGMPGHDHFVRPTKQQRADAEHQDKICAASEAESLKARNDKAMRSAMDRVNETVEQVLTKTQSPVFDSVSKFCNAMGRQDDGRFVLKDRLPVATIATSLNWRDNQGSLGRMAVRLKREK